MANKLIGMVEWEDTGQSCWMACEDLSMSVDKCVENKSCEEMWLSLPVDNAHDGDHNDN